MSDKAKEAAERQRDEYREKSMTALEHGHPMDSIAWTLLRLADMMEGRGE